MSKEDDKKKVLSISAKKIDVLKPNPDSVRQSFSHGRSKAVTVEVKRKRHIESDKIKKERLRALQEIAMKKQVENQIKIAEEAEKFALSNLRQNIVNQINAIGTKKLEYYKGKMSNSPVQNIYFGPPGTGKSYKIRSEVIERLGIDEDCTVETMFHPDYSYGDFFGKLMPLSIRDRDGGVGRVSYDFYPGDFLYALGLAYKEIFHPVMGVPRNVVLIIDEINRGNCASIFGNIFQLLDRGQDGFSSYAVRMGEMEKKALLKMLLGSNTKMVVRDPSAKRAIKYLRCGKMVIPPNLSIIATMNTSDESIYYMDSAFKRRWDWDYVPAGERNGSSDLDLILINNDIGSPTAIEWRWVDFVDGINEIILGFSSFVRQIEDKQIGYRFIKPDVKNDGKMEIPLSKIRGKVLFFIWDTIFPRNKSPLEDLVGRKLNTFKDFSDSFEGVLKTIKNNMQG